MGSEMCIRDSWIPSHQRNGKISAIFSPDHNWKVRLDADLMNNKVTNLDSVKRPLFKPYAFDDYFYNHRTNYALSLDHWINKKLFLQGVASYNHFRRIKNTLRYDFEKDTAVLLQPEFQDTSVNDASLARISVGGRELLPNLDFVFGIDNYYENISGQRLQDTLSGRSDFAFNNETGVFGSIQYKLYAPLTLSLASRWINNRLYGSAFTPLSLIHI